MCCMSLEKGAFAVGAGSVAITLLGLLCAIVKAVSGRPSGIMLAIAVLGLSMTAAAITFGLHLKQKSQESKVRFTKTFLICALLGLTLYLLTMLIRASGLLKLLAVLVTTVGYGITYYLYLCLRSWAELPEGY